MSDSETQPASGTENQSDDCEEGSARINCSLGGLDLEVEGGTVEETEALFERVWKRRISEADSFSEALRSRLVGHQ
jgi:hypothetical protein